jgi:DNA-binding protein HU-beta
MTKAELIERISRSRDLPPDISKKDLALILNVAFDELKSYFVRARVTRSSSPRFTVPHFGTFTKKKRSARMGVNPRTLEPMRIEAFDTLDFKASKELREALNPASKDGAAPKVAAKATRAPAKAKAVTKRRRSLTPRDDADLLDDDKLPAAPLQRVRTGSRSRRRGTG